VSKFTEKDHLKAKIEGAKNYRGPLKGDPMRPLTKRRVDPFDLKSIEKLTDAAIEDWLRDEVLEGLS